MLACVCVCVWCVCVVCVRVCVVCVCCVVRAGGGLYTGSGKDSSAMFGGSQPDPELAVQVDQLQKEVKQLEIESEHQRQAKKLQVAIQNDGSSRNLTSEMRTPL